MIDVNLSGYGEMLAGISASAMALIFGYGKLRRVCKFCRHEAESHSVMPGKDFLWCGITKKTCRFSIIDKKLYDALYDIVCSPAYGSQPDTEVARWIAYQRHISEREFILRRCTVAKMNPVAWFMYHLKYKRIVHQHN